MPDLVYLSLWLRDYSAANMLQHWKHVIEAFPASPAAPGIQSLTVHPFHWGETPVFERIFGEDVVADDAVTLATEFLHDDYAYEVEMKWDLWVPVSADVPGGWDKLPTSISVTCLGPGFDREGSDGRADIQINFGLDTPFLPAEDDESAELELNPDPDFDSELADLRMQHNLQQLVGFVHRLDQMMPVEKRLLWCESGENLAEKILDAWNLRL